MKYIILTAILILGACSVALAGPPMTWDECVRELIENNPELRAARDTVEQARAGFMSKFSAFLPQLYAGGDAGKSKSESDDGYSDSTSYSTYLTARQSIFEGFRNRAALDQNRALLTAAEMDLRRVKSDLSYSLQNAFAQMLFAQDFVKLAKAIIARRKDNLNLVQLRFEAGRENKGSYLRSRALLHQADYDIAQAGRSLTVARRRMATTLGWQDETMITVTGKWEVAVPPKTPDFLELVKSTPDHQKATARWQATKEGVRIAKSDFYPDVSASASLGRRGDDFLPDNNRWSVGMTVSLPLFTGGSRFYSVQGARAEQRVAEAGLINTGCQLALTLEEKFAAWQDAIEQRDVQADFLHAAEVRAEIARSQYSNGLISFQDWDLIENDLINYEKAMLGSLRNAVVAEASWEKALGIGVIP